MRPYYFLVLFLLGCATYQSKLTRPLIYLQNGHADQAAAMLKEDAFKESDDQLVYLLDYGLAEQAAGAYKESNKAFLQAADVAELKDYHSISRIAGSLVLSEGMVQYKGDEYEKLLIHVYAALNFLMLKQYDEARVEVRRIHERVDKLKMDGEKFFEENPFAFYISALIWEQTGNSDSAYIDYKNTFKYAPHFAQVREDLLRMSYIKGRQDDYAKYKQQFSDVKIKEKEWKDKSQGELVVIYQQGRGPKKQPHPSSNNLPKLYPTYSSGVQARVFINDKLKDETSILLDLQDLAISTLDRQYAALIAKRVAGVAVKAVIASQVDRHAEGLGQLAWIAMNMADQADLRQWVTLPQTFQVARITLPPGKYKMKIAAINVGDSETGEMIEQEIQISARRKTFYNWRSFK